MTSFQCTTPLVNASARLTSMTTLGFCTRPTVTWKPLPRCEVSSLGHSTWSFVWMSDNISTNRKLFIGARKYWCSYLPLDIQTFQRALRRIFKFWTPAEIENRKPATCLCVLLTRWSCTTAGRRSTHVVCARTQVTSRVSTCVTVLLTCSLLAPTTASKLHQNYISRPYAGSCFSICFR